MKVSLNWLNEYVNLSDLAVTTITTALTDAGLEVESVQGGSAIGPEVVVGRIVEAKQHPNADSLRLCEVDIGASEPLRIVCGAPNARANIFVAVATVGAVLPGNFKIKKSKIRGEESQGMLCSESELGIGSGDDGIIEISGAPALGTPVAKVLGLEDIVLELNITPNRGDCLGYIGLARDLAAKLGRTLKEPPIMGTRTSGLTTADTIEVKLSDPDACPRFVALYMRGVATVASPSWMQKRLEAAGMRPINVIVDATNYAMLEYGQPVHAYDLRDIRGKQIEVRTAKAGESLVTLDGHKRILADGDILICDREGPIGLAGIMGGRNSEVKADTTEIVLEVAAFASARIRKTARRLALHTEASHRFERGIDIDAIPRVAHRVADLIALGLKEVSSTSLQIAADDLDAFPVDVSKRVITLRLSQAKQVLGLSYLKKEEVVQVFEALQFELLDSNEERLVFEIPFWRNDIMREIDLIEEVGRMLGFDKIPYQLPIMNIRPTPEDGFIDFQEQARTAFAGVGFRETISFPFVAASEIQALGLRPGHPLFPTLTLANPLSEQHSLMQTTLVAGLLRASSQNRRAGLRGARLFECGRGYYDFNAAKDVPVDLSKSVTWRLLGRPGRHLTRRAKDEKNRPVERHWLAAVIDQPWSKKSWNAEQTLANFYHGKAAVMAMLDAFGIDAQAVQFLRIDTTDLPYLHPGAAASLFAGNRALGYVGELHPRVAAAFDLTSGGEHALNAAPIILEIDLEVLFDLKQKPLKLDTTLRRFPPVTRDLAFLADKIHTHQDIVQSINKFKQRQHLQYFELFDVYESSSLPAGKKSLAYGFVFQSPDRTLTDGDVEQEINALVLHLNQTLGLSQRA